MTDIASLGLKIDTSQVTEGTKALDQLAGASVRVEQAAKNTNGQMADTAKIMRAQAEQARATAAANVALGNTTDRMSIGAQLFIEKLQDQAAVLGMSRSQLAAYQAAQMGVSKEAEQSVAKLKAYEDQIKAAADAKAAAASRANQLTDALGLLAKGYAALKVAEYIKDAALLAARYETLGVVAEVVGRNAGYTKTQMDYATDAIARQGITMVESRQSAIKLVQAHVDLTNATGLARIAQDAAVIGNINSSEAFDRLVNGISRGNVLILRNIGINVNLQSAYAQMADSLGKSTKELTENERVQARLGAVMERGTDIAGTYEAAMGTAGKQLLSMKRYTDDLKTTIGEVFNETLTVSVMAWTDHLKDSNHEVTELSKNQQLHEWGRSLAGVFVGVANTVNNATTTMQKVWAWADHMSARDSIKDSFKDKAKENAKNTSFWEVGFTDKGKRLAAERDAALAEENVAYAKHQAELNGQFDKYAKAQEERDKATNAKRKGALDERLKVDQDYASKAAALAVANSGKSVAEQQAAQMALAKSVYVGTPTYRDTEGREPKAKVDQAESTAMADHIARLEAVAAAEKKHYADLSTLDDMYHKAGVLSDQQYYDNKRKYSDGVAAAQLGAYDKEIAALVAHDNATAAEEAKTQKQIDDIWDKRTAAKAANAAESFRLDEEERLRQKAIVSASDDAINKYLGNLDQEARKLEESNAGHETSKGAVERETIARLDLAIAYQKQFMADQVAAGASAAELAQAPAVLKYLEDQRVLRERIAMGLDQADVDKANKKAAEQAGRDWDKTAKHVETTLADAIVNGGANAWKKLKAAIASQVLSVPLQMVGGSIASALYPGAAQAGGSSLLGAAGNASSIYNASTGGMAGLTGMAGSGIASIGNALGMSSLSAFGAGFGGAGAGAGMMTAAETFAGAGMAAEATAASLGSAFAAAVPWVGAALAAVAVWNKFFESGPEEHTRLQFASNNAVGNINNNERGESWAAPYIGNGSNSSLGTFGVRQTFWGDANGEVVQSFIKTVGQTDDALAAFMTTAEKASVTGYLTGKTFTANTGAEGSNPNATGELDKVFADRINNILTGVEPGLASLVAGFAGTSQALATEAAALLSYRAALKDSGEAVFGVKVTMQEIAALKQPTETTSAALARVTNEFTATSQVAQMLGVDVAKAFGATGLASEAARAQLILLSGGLQTFSTQSAAFAQTYLTDEERSRALVKQVGEQMAVLGYASVTTKDQFKDLVLGLVSSGAVATEAGAKQYAALMNVSAGFATAADAAAAAVAKAQESAKVTAGLNGQIYDLTHTDAEALARQRQLELAAMTATDAELQKRIYALTDEKAAAAELATVKAKQAADLATIKGARGGIADEIFKAVLGGKDLQGKIDQLKGAEAAAWSGVGSGVDSIAALEKIKALAMQRIDLEGQLQDQAITDLKAQYDLRAQGLTTELNAMVKMRDFAQQLLGYTNGLKLGDLSALSPTAKLAEAESQYRTALGKARDGDVTAQGGLQGIAQTYLQLQKQYSGSTSSYASTYASVITALETLAGTAPTDPQIESQKLQISTIQSTSAALSTTVRDTSAKQVEVLQRIDAAMAKSQTNVEAQLAQAGAANAALVEELKKSNGKLAEIEARMARMEASA